MGMPLAAVPDHRHPAVADDRRVGIAVVLDGCHFAQPRSPCSLTARSLAGLDLRLSGHRDPSRLDQFDDPVGPDQIQEVVDLAGLPGDLEG